MIRLGSAGDFLRRHPGAEREAVDPFGEEQQFEDREPELVRIVRRRGKQQLARVARRPHEPRHVAQQPLREVGEAQFLVGLHFAAHDPLVHRLVERNQRLLEELAQPLADQQLRQMILQLADAVLAEQPHRIGDFRRERRRLRDGQPDHRLQRRVGERDDRARAPPLGQQLLDQLEARDLVGRIHAIAERIAQRRGKAVAALPHVELLAAQPRDAHDLADVQRARGLADRDRRRVRGRSGRVLAA